MHGSITFVDSLGAISAATNCSCTDLLDFQSATERHE